MRTLGCADNGLEDLTPLAPLWALRTADLRDNQLQSIRTLEPLLGSAMGLRELKVAGNPGTTPAAAPAKTKARDAIILMAGQRLQQLDEAEVTDNQRHFIYAREMKRQGLPVPGSGGGRTAAKDGRRGHHHPTGSRDVRGVAGGGWRGSKGKLHAAPTHSGHVGGGAGGGSSVPSFAPSAAAAVPGGRPMPKEGVQRAPSSRKPPVASSVAQDLQGLALSGVAHKQASDTRGGARE